MRVSIQSLSKSFGSRVLFEDFSLELHSGSRLSVVGPNGTGKSTFVRMIAGEVGADGGRISLPKGARLGYVAQELDDGTLETPLLSWVLDVLPSWSDFWRDWEQALADNDTAGLERLSKRQAELEQVYGYNPEHRAHSVLSGLGFAEDTHEQPLKTFSGGWRERAKLARVLVAGADVLLLDEPTNHLDLEAVEWLEQFLLEYQGVLIFVAHDRIFMDKVGTHILYLGGGKPAYRKGNFTQFLEWQEEFEEQRRREAKKIKEDIDKKMAFVRRFKYKATKARQAGSRKKQVQKLEKELADIRFEPKRKQLGFKWPEPARSGKTPMSVVGISVAFGQGPKLWAPLSFSLYRGQRIALAGPNGCGKSTLLKALVGQLEPVCGNVEFDSMTRVGYFSQHQSETLDMDYTVLGEIRRLSDPRTTEEELMSVLGLFLLGEEYFERKVGDLSGGEKNRLVLASLFLKRANLLILDEPTNHLDLESREALMQALEDFEGTILMVAHDRWLLKRVAEQVWALSEDGLAVFEDGFDEYDRARREDARLQEIPACEDREGEGPVPGQSLSREEQKRIKREQAERRNAVYKELKPRKAQFERCEARLELLLQRSTELEELLADPELYSNMEKSAPLLKEYKDIQDESERVLEEMSGLEETITRLEEERSACS